MFFHHKQISFIMHKNSESYSNIDFINYKETHTPFFIFQQIETTDRSMVKVYLPHEFKCDTEMIAEIEVFSHVDDVELVVFVSPTQSVQNLDLHQCLVVKSIRGNDPN